MQILLEERIYKSFKFELGDYLLSRVLRQSTISAVRFHVRVRNGILCFTYAMITKLKFKA